MYPHINIYIVNLFVKERLSGTVRVFTSCFRFMNPRGIGVVLGRIHAHTRSTPPCFYVIVPRHAMIIVQQSTHATVELGVDVRELPLPLEICVVQVIVTVEYSEVGSQV